MSRGAEKMKGGRGGVREGGGESGTGRGGYILEEVLFETSLDTIEEELFDYEYINFHRDNQSLGNESLHNGSYGYEDYMYTWEDDGQGVFGWVVNICNVVVIPIIVLIGVIGNTLSLIVFLKSHLRYQSSSVYLAFLNIVDTGFLLALFVTWFSWLDIHVFHQQGLCQAVVYVTYVFSFLSVWTVVAFTIERFIVVYRPLERQSLCTRKRARIAIGIITATALLLYSFALWTTGVVYLQNRGTCIAYMEYFSFLNIVTHIDTIITFVIPCLIIAVLNGMITYKIYRFLSKRNRTLRDHGKVCEDKLSSEHCSSSSTSHNNKDRERSDRERPDRERLEFADCGVYRGTATAVINPNQLHHATQQNGTTAVGGGRQDNTKKHHAASVTSRSANSLQARRSLSVRSCAATNVTRRNFQLRTTRALVIVSTVFVALNLPSHVFRIHALLSSIVGDGDYILPRHAMVWQQVCHLFSYMNFAANFFLYVVCSRSFRGSFQRMCKRFRNRVHAIWIRCRWWRYCRSWNKTIHHRFKYDTDSML